MQKHKTVNAKSASETNQAQKVVKFLAIIRKITGLIKILPFVIAVIFIAFYAYAQSQDVISHLSEVQYFVVPGSPLLLIALAMLSYWLEFCKAHQALFLMPLIIYALIYIADNSDLMAWANDMSYTAIIIMAVLSTTATALICFLYGDFKK